MPYFAEQEIYCPLTEVKCHTNLLKLAKESQKDSQASETNTNDYIMSTMDDQQVSDENMAAVENNINEEKVQIEEMNLNIQELPNGEKQIVDPHSNLCIANHGQVCNENNKDKTCYSIPKITVTNPDNLTENLADLPGLGNDTPSSSLQAMHETCPYTSANVSLGNQSTVMSQSSLPEDGVDAKHSQTCVNTSEDAFENASDHTEPPVQETNGTDASEKFLLEKQSSTCSLQIKSIDGSMSLDLPSAELVSSKPAAKSNLSLSVPDTSGGDYAQNSVKSNTKKCASAETYQEHTHKNLLANIEFKIVDKKIVIQSDNCLTAQQTSELGGNVADILFNEIEENAVTDKANQEKVNKCFYNNESGLPETNAKSQDPVELDSYDCNNSHNDEEEYLLAEAESIFFAEIEENLKEIQRSNGISVENITPTNDVSQTSTCQSLKSQVDQLLKSSEKPEFTESDKNAKIEAPQVNSETEYGDGVNTIKTAGNQRLVISGVCLSFVLKVSFNQLIHS